MPQSELRLIKQVVEYCPQKEVENIQPWTRGIYVLFQYRPEGSHYDVVYVGLAGGQKAGIRGRLRRHVEDKKDLWTHFSVFEVWDNVREEEIEELEGLFRHIYRKDSKANMLNKAKAYHKLIRIRKATEAKGELLRAR